MASTYRLRRGPVLGLLLVIGVLGGLLVARSATRPVVDVYGALAVPDAYVGTTYAFDGLVCVRASSLGATVARVQVRQEAAATRLGLAPPGAPVAVAFPVAPDALVPLDGVAVAAGDQRCTRLLVTPQELGERAAAPVRVSFRYGPLGLLRTTAEVVPPVSLQVTGTGTDPRTTG